jgi:hypothetical protein
VLRVERAFLAAAEAVYGQAGSSSSSSSSHGAGPGGHRQRHDPRLARFYMWHQTANSVHIAAYLPTGGVRSFKRVHIAAAGLPAAGEAGI